ncbi:hypothetical protein B4U80_03146 [Leptotrombidium deliense]|uniref:Uncharacterized protein n=1 Tax=Leptotrombidium deliense TaxID=299467 RepID=A0A443ST67_9ACAR|nr:hypothetical protein B4U80_03146 [Leptotrombidium deliense]
MYPATTYLTCFFAVFCYRLIPKSDISCPFGCTCIGTDKDRSLFCNANIVIFSESYRNFRTLHLIDIKNVENNVSQQSLFLKLENLIIDKANNVLQSKPERIRVMPTFVTVTNSKLSDADNYFYIDSHNMKKIHYENVTEMEYWFPRSSSSVISITILKSPIKTISPHLFKCKNLEYLVLRHTEISGSLSPNWFGIELKNLTHLDLSYNKLRTIDESVFKNLPSLKTLKLNNNLLVGISWDTMKPIWNNLNEFWLKENEHLICDNFCWIFGHFPHPSIFDSTDCWLSTIPLKQTHFFNLSLSTIDLNLNKI